jgi:hypothetical protein
MYFHLKLGHCLSDKIRKEVIKMAHIYDVKQFGAVGDGGSDILLVAMCKS